MVPLILGNPHMSEGHGRRLRVGLRGFRISGSKFRAALIQCGHSISRIRIALVGVYTCTFEHEPSADLDSKSE